MRDPTPAQPPTLETTASTAVEKPSEAVSPITGHRSYPQVPTQLSKSPDLPQPASESQDGKSIAPALGAVRAKLEKLLKEAGPDGAAAAVAALPGTRNAIERSLNDPDPAVRAEASALLKALSPPQPQ
jgi:hypothetical protein